MLGLIGPRKRLTLRGKRFAWRLLSEAYSETGNELDRALIEADQEQVLAKVKARLETEMIPPWIWQLVLSYVAQILINWIIEKYLTPPQFPANEVGDDEEVSE